MEVGELIYNARFWVSDTDAGVLSQGIGALLAGSGFGVLRFVEHYFEPQGYTCFWLLAESHVAVHTFPEHGRTYIEVTSCNRSRSELLCSSLTSHFSVIQQS